MDVKFKNVHNTSDLVIANHILMIVKNDANIKNMYLITAVKLNRE